MPVKRVLLTGGTGFVGANLARRLLVDGHDVHLLVRPEHRNWRIAEIRDAVQFHTIDLAWEEGVLNIVQEVRPDWVFHLAVYGAYADQKNFGSMVRTNISGTIHLVSACLNVGIDAFVNTGSSSEYGYKDHAPCESEWLDPNSNYAVTKAFTTQYCRYAAQNQTVNLRTLRLYSVFGPYESPCRLFPAVISAGLKGELPALADAETCRDFIYVEDVIDAYLLAASRPCGDPGEVYNVGTGVQTTLRDVVDVARSYFGISARPKWGTMADRRWDTNVWVADSLKLRDELGWRPRFTVKRGFRKMVEWARENTPP